MQKSAAIKARNEAIVAAEITFDKAIVAAERHLQQRRDIND